MKTSKQLLIALCCAWVCMSCDNLVNYNDTYLPAEQIKNTGAPKIHAVYDVADLEKTTPIHQGELNQMVRVVGKNLNDAHAIRFNTVEVDMQEIYTMGNEAIVRIPNILSREQVNAIEYTTSLGTATYDFIIPFPALQVTGVENEFANAGDSLIILGNHFDIYEFGSSSHVCLGEQQLPIGMVAQDKMTVYLPEDIQENTIITVRWTNEKNEAFSKNLSYRPTHHLLYGNWEDTQVNVAGQLKVTKESDEAITTGAAWLNREHLHLQGSLGAWSWNTIDLSRNMIDQTVENPEEWVLKFELLTAENFPLQEIIPLQFCFNWGETYAWELTTVNTFGQWRTMTLPLAPMATKGIAAAGAWQTLRLVVQPTQACEIDCRIANLRLEKL
ncbi:MAG: hypothetical protein IJ989_03625 [Paludibacteraceae bacterium]|nr:hypothetical protein [Paludibacteraceae bacterium]